MGDLTDYGMNEIIDNITSTFKDKGYTVSCFQVEENSSDKFKEKQFYFCMNFNSPYPDLKELEEKILDPSYTGSRGELNISEITDSDNKPILFFRYAYKNDPYAQWFDYIYERNVLYSYIIGWASSLPDVENK